jgi:hypothetical protein
MSAQKKIKYTDFPVEQWFVLLVKAYRLPPLTRNNFKNPLPVIEVGDYHVMISSNNDFRNDLIISVGKWCSETNNAFIGVMSFNGDGKGKLRSCGSLGGSKIENHIYDIQRWIEDIVTIDAAVGELADNGIRDPMAYYIPEMKKNSSSKRRQTSGFSVGKRYVALREMGNNGVSESPIWASSMGPRSSK